MTTVNVVCPRTRRARIASDASRRPDVRSIDPASRRVLRAGSGLRRGSPAPRATASADSTGYYRHAFRNTAISRYSLSRYGMPCKVSPND
jgi:hypothetical protein